MVSWKTATGSGLLSERVLGVAVEEHRISLARMKVTFKEQILTGTVQIPRPAGASAEDTAFLVARAVEEHDMQADRFVLGLSGNKAFWRSIS
ncbi:MAG: hypothetical protein ACOC0U_04405, partial [Desulfovibrionales bacterium]